MRHNLPAWLALATAALIIWFLAAPPRWWLNLTKPVDLSDAPAAGALVVERYGCRECHRIGGRGALTGPDLAGVTRRLGHVELRSWLIDPRAVAGRAAMPNLRLSDAEIAAIIAYLETQGPPT